MCMKKTQQNPTTQKLPIKALQSATRALNLYTSFPQVSQTSDVSDPHQVFSENLSSELWKCSVSLLAHGI